jgi:hypothetical protein
MAGRDLLEDLVYGDGVEYAIEEGYVDPDEVDPALRDFARLSIAAYETYKQAARIFREAAKKYLEESN